MLNSGWAKFGLANIALASGLYVVKSSWDFAAYIFDDSCQNSGDNCYQCENIDSRYDCEQMFCSWNEDDGLCGFPDGLDGGTCINDEITEETCCISGCGHPGNPNNFTFDSCVSECNKQCPVILTYNNNNWTKCVDNKSVSYAYLDKSIGVDRDYSVEFIAT